MNYAYVYAGLHIQSALPIPEWAAFECADSDGADVYIRLENGSRDWEMPAPDAPIVSTDEYCFSVPEVGAYRVTHGREIRIAPDHGTCWREVRLFLLGSAWGALCYQRELLALHVSAVRVDNGAIAFCAHPQKGKSTLAAYLTEAGHPLVSDDLTRIEIPAQGLPLIYPAARHLKLWWDALDALGWQSPSMVRDHYRFEKFYLPLDGNGQIQPLPLHAIYVLEWGELGITQRTGQAALHGLVSAATYRGTLLEPMGKMGWYYRQCLELIRRIPIWQFQRPRDLALMDQAVRYLQNHWMKNGDLYHIKSNYSQNPPPSGRGHPLHQSPRRDVGPR